MSVIMASMPLFSLPLLSQAHNSQESATSTTYTLPSSGSIVPAKREDDDVQFVSENAVKKRRVDSPERKNPPSDISDPGLIVAVPTHTTGSSAQVANSDPLAEGRISIGRLGQPEVPPAADSDQSRGCSAPALEKTYFPDTFWSAPATGPRSSPALSPKQVLEHISPSLLRLEPVSRDARHVSNTSKSAEPGQSADKTQSLLGSPWSQTQPTQPVTLRAAVHQPEGAQTESNVDENHHEQTGYERQLAGERGAKPQHRPTGVAVSAQAPTPISHGLSKTTSSKTVSSRPAVEHYQEAKETIVSSNSAIGPEALSHKLPDFPAPMSTNLFKHNEHANTSTTDSSLRLTKPQQNSPADRGLHAESGTGDCVERSKSSTKGPCLQCIEKRLRQLYSGAFPLPGTSSSGTSSHVPQVCPSLSPQTWSPHLGMSAFPNQVAAPFAFGQFAANPQLATSNPSQIQGQRGIKPAPCSEGRNLQMTTRGFPISQMDQVVDPFHSHMAQGAMAFNVEAQAAPTQPGAQPVQSTQTNGKHLIVDIADTCVDLFPFEEVAQRHDQPVQKIRDIFEAVVQVPLLRCSTDKRRAGKLGTAKVKEYSQAKKEVTSKHGETTPRRQHQQKTLQGQELEQGRTQRQAQGQPHSQALPYIPSAWELAQYLGASDINFPGPW